MISDKLRAATHLLHRHLRGEVQLDADTATALILHLDQVALDVARLERGAVVRAVSSPAATHREEQLVGLVYCAAQQVPGPSSLQILAMLRKVMTSKPELIS